MTPDELDNALSEISTRMERVRALYEQYFMGIERTEPAIPKKDLDRRIETLRKVRFQNTAKRFKFQTLVQRYTSLQQYWYRTCRDIENGTYKKHVQKAKRRFEEVAEENAMLPADTERERAEHAVSAKKAAENDLASLLDANIDVEAEMHKALSAFEAKESPSEAQRSGEKKGLLRALGKRDTQGQDGDGRTTSPRLTLDQLPKTEAQADRPSLLGRTTATSPRPALAGLPPLKKTATLSPGAKAAPAEGTSASPAARPPGPPGPPPPRSSTPAARPAGAPGAPPPRSSAETRGTPVAPPQAALPAAGAKAPLPPPRVGTAAPVHPKSPTPPARSTDPTARPTATGPLPTATSPRPTEAGARPTATGPKPTAASPRPTAAGANPSAASLSEDKLRAIHARYQDARAKTNATAVSFEKLAQSIRETEKQLRAKHQGKNVDFDVSIKDGKAIIKPKLT